MLVNEVEALIEEVKKNNGSKLILVSKGLTSLPKSVLELKQLTQLYLSDNQLTSLPSEISKLENLTELYINKNNLVSLPSEISELKKLTKLSLFENKLNSLPPGISKLRKLTELDLSNNQLTVLPSGISRLDNLSKLDLSNNQFASLPLEILDLQLDINWESVYAKGVFIGDNPFVYPPVEILLRGRKSIIEYFNSFQGKFEELNEVKVLLVGEGGAGKTSLVKKIFKETVDGNESQTQGINIRKWVVEDEEREIKANFWDFGGQEIMHATHQFFLSKRSLYILVLDGRRDERPEYWLKLIENFGGDSPVMIVINKIDENPAYELNRKFLQDKYPSIRSFHRLSCKSNEGVNVFSEALREELTKVKHLETKWPKSWLNVKSELEKICPNYSSNIDDKNVFQYFNFIEYEKYKQICEEEGIKSESEQNTLVDFLHDLGVILHFKDIPLLNTYVLEPEWVTNAVYKIITSKIIAESKGILKPDDMLPEILKQRSKNDFYYPPYQYSFFVSLMRKFELSYDLDNSTILLPTSLEIQEPNFEFEFNGALKFIIDYDFFPSSVMPRFIVKMHGDIKDDLRWTTGVVLENINFNSYAVIRADNEAKRINIYVSGEQRRDYFAVILQKFREINNSFRKLKATEKIPLPDKPAVTVSYSHLIKLEKKGIENYMPDGSDYEYKVSDLLGTIINRSSERLLLEEILQITKINKENEKEILKVVRKLQEIETGNESDDTLFNNLIDAISVDLPLIPISLDLSKIRKIVKLYRQNKAHAIEARIK